MSGSHVVPNVNLFDLMFLLVDYGVQSTPDNSNLQGKSKKGSSYREFEENSRVEAESMLKKKQFLLHTEHFNHI